jgi:hypothetical protein
LYGKAVLKRNTCQVPSSTLPKLVEAHDAAKALAGMHQLECFVDLLKLECVCDVLVKARASLEVLLDELWNLCTAPCHR